MDMYTNPQIKAWLEAGVNVILTPNGDPLLLQPDGSVLNKMGQLVLGAETYRAFLYAKYYGRQDQAGRLFSLGAPAVLDVDGVHAAITGSATLEVVTEDDFTDPDVPRNITITPGGTTADVKAALHVVYGTDYGDNPISENFTFEANAEAAVVGTKAFKTVTKHVMPAQDGAAATFTIGYGNEIGLPFAMDATSEIMLGILGTTITAHNPTVSAPVSLAGSTIDMSAGTYNGTKLALVFLKV